MTENTSRGRGSLAEDREHRGCSEETKAANHTPGPYRWAADDFSMVSLVGKDDEHVLSLTMCRSCCDRAKAEKREHWLWGDCHTPTLTNATFIRRALNAHADLVAALREIEAELDQTADVDDGIPNEAMKVLVIIRAALAKATQPSDTRGKANPISTTPNNDLP